MPVSKAVNAQMLVTIVATLHLALCGEGCGVGSTDGNQDRASTDMKLTIYLPPPVTGFMSWGGAIPRCLRASALGAQATITSSDCNLDDFSERWVLSFIGDNSPYGKVATIRPQSNQNLCLDIVNNDPTQNNVQLWDCNGTDAQSWSLLRERISSANHFENFSSWCLDVGARMCLSPPGRLIAKAPAPPNRVAGPGSVGPVLRDSPLRPVQ